MSVSSSKKVEFISYKFKEVAHVLYILLKENMPVESGRTELVDINKAFIGKYFPFEKREVYI